MLKMSRRKDCSRPNTGARRATVVRAASGLSGSYRDTLQRRRSSASFKSSPFRWPNKDVEDDCILRNVLDDSRVKKSSSSSGLPSDRSKSKKEGDQKSNAAVSVETKKGNSSDSKTGYKANQVSVLMCC